MRFDDLKLSEAVLRAVHAEGYETPTPIQQKAIPHVLAGKDLVGCAQTGTGKTAAFALPILSRLGPQGTTESAREPGTLRDDHARPAHLAPSTDRRPRVLVLTPTRELAVQIGESFTTYGKFTGLRSGLIFGGVSQSGQERMLRAGVDILVATPGRLMDMMNQRLVHLTNIEVFVLDEADRMLDMGFIADIRKIIAKLPVQRQTLLFSATMPSEIKRLADGILRQPVHVAVSPVSSTAERVVQTLYHVEKRAKPALVMHLLNTDRSIQRVLVFTRTKHGADRLAKGLAKHGVVAEAIHGNKSQNQRQRALDTFKQGDCRVLVATDIAARGLDIELVSHVINYELPNIPESYVHRIGRTGRAGESGVAISFCDAEEREFLRDIEKVISSRIPVVATPTSLGTATTTFGQERDSDRRALGGSAGGRGRGQGGRGRDGGGGGGGSGRGRPERMDSRPAASPGSSPRPTAPQRPTHSSAPRPTERPAPQWRSDSDRPAPDSRPPGLTRPMPTRPEWTERDRRPEDRDRNSARPARPAGSAGRPGFDSAPRRPSPAPAWQGSRDPTGRPPSRGPAGPGGNWRGSDSRSAGPRPDDRRGPPGPRDSRSFGGPRDQNRPSAGSPYRGGPSPRPGSDGRRPTPGGGSRPEPSRPPGPGRPDTRHR